MNDQLNSLLQKGASHHMMNQFQEAHDCYMQVIKAAPTSHHAHHLLGLLFSQNGFMEQSEIHFARSLEIKPDCKEALCNRSIFKQSSDSKIQAEFDHVEINETYQQFQESTVGGWRHLRMVDFVASFANDKDTWLTLGDAHGHDAYMLNKSGVKNITASNLESSNLKAGFKAKLVDKFLTINAESIPLENESFDYVLCKEALHHMPRPMMAIYEMLRVARKGVFFIEPQDQVIDWPVRRHEDFYRDIIPADAIGEKVSIKKTSTHEEVSSSYMDWWEDQAFNYVYTFSKREIRKMALGMGLPSFAIKNFNDFYNPDWNSQDARPGIEGFEKTLEQIQMHDKVCEITGKAYSYITGLLFKETPSTSIVRQLSELGYQFNFTPTRYLPIKWPNLKSNN
jgi:ubiquinone/menaquinone biosynthesis C-methylase UbiE